ncbi:type VI secretion system-associated protein TagF [Inquilinus sp.]|uniref:type VI secretion system-associated protein TagF n=1 Tax=Inquilinus sp. TaxID=1932117 RepID=UPI0037837554
MPGAAMIGPQADSPAVGFFGKIPSRGDFLCVGLSLGFIQAWDGWLQGVLADVQRTLGEGWAEVWRVAPVWRFALPSGQCGHHPVLGLWMPSIDRVGRPFPLTIAAEGADQGDAFLDAVERIGREAISYDLGPEAVMDRLREAPQPSAASDPRQGARWWSDGGPLAEAAELVLDTLPDSVGFARMLGR